jgi:hypothetical protein
MTQLEMKIGLDASQALPMVRKIGMMDPGMLQRGCETSSDSTHVIFLGIIYPVAPVVVRLT